MPDIKGSCRLSPKDFHDFAMTNSQFSIIVFLIKTLHSQKFPGSSQKMLALPTFLNFLLLVEMQKSGKIEEQNQ